MKKIILLFLILGFFSACRKTNIDDVHFHGHILDQCTGQPVANVEVEIVVNFYSGRTDRKILGYATTDQNGYYDLITDVSYNGNNGSYSMSGYYPTDEYYTIGPMSSKDISSSRKDVIINGTAIKNLNLFFHIKNVAPYDMNDVFDTLRYYSVRATHLLGMSVDTILRFKHPQKYSLYVRYSYTKNGISSNEYKDLITDCSDSLTLNIFY